MLRRLCSLLTLLCLTFAPAFAASSIDLGIDTLRKSGFKNLEGKRVGLLTHPAGVDRNGTPTWKVLKDAPQVNLVALFGPEHGVDGKAQANEYVPSRTHTPTGLPAYSLYDKTRKPTPEMLAGIDILVIDLQDVGVRSYTYVSAMKNAMEACFQQGVGVMVLDRPNPLGGLKVDGPPLDPKFESYVGEFPVPYVHGLTIGELSFLAKRTPGVLDISDTDRQNGQLLIVPMGGWKRSMLWPQTGLKWVPTSPAIPDLGAVMGYAMTGLGCQLGGFRHGVGTQYPFRLLSYPGRSPESVMRALQAHNIKGLSFQLTDGKTPAGGTVPGVYVRVTDWNQLKPTEISFHMMRLACAWSPENPFSAATPQQQLLFNKHVGSEAWFNALTQDGANVDVDRFVNEWSRLAYDYQLNSRKFWLYQP
ncbi:MAG: DUF1343 domain-containing protein [Puniceicoccales bacterium]